MTKTKLQIDISPITHNIYVGRAKPGANCWSGEKEDVTPKAIHCVAEHVLNKFSGVMTLTVNPPGKPQIAYTIEVKKYIGGEEIKQS